MQDSLRNKTLKGTVWSFADALLGQGVTFVVGLILARLLSPNEYGIIGIILIFIAISNSIVDSGFSSALIRKIDSDDLDYNTVFYSNLFFSIILFIVLYFCAPAIASFFNIAQLVVLMRVMGIVLIINAFSLIQKTLLEKKIDFKTQAKVSVIASVSSGAIGISMAISGYGVWSLVGQQISRQLLFSIFLWVFNKWRPSLLFSLSRFKELFNFGWKLLVSGIIESLWKEIYQVVIGKCYTAQTLGQYTRAHQFASVFSSNLTMVVQRVSFPVLSSIQDDRLRLKMAYKKVIKITMLVTFTCMLGLVAIAKPMILVLIGEQWLPAVAFLQIICLNMMLYPLHAINLNMLKIQGRSDLFLVLEILKKIIGVGPLLLGIFVNIYWMLIGSVITGFISYYLNSFYSGRLLSYSMAEQICDILPSFGIALGMSVVVFVISFLPLAPIALLAIQLFVGAIIALVLCRVFKLEEYFELKQIVFSFIKKFRNGR